MVRQQKHTNNLIWLLMLLWFFMAMSLDAVSLADRISKPDTLGHHPLAIQHFISADNDDATIPMAQKVPFKAIPSFGEIICATVPTRDTGYYHIAIAVFSCFVSIHLQKYMRRKTRTPSFSSLSIS